MAFLRLIVARVWLNRFWFLAFYSGSWFVVICVFWPVGFFGLLVVDGGVWGLI